MKTCSKCNAEKSLDCFVFRKDQNNYRSYCKECKAIQDKANYENRKQNTEWLNKSREDGLQRSRSQSKEQKERSKQRRTELRQSKRKHELLLFFDSYGFTYEEYLQDMLLHSFISRSTKRHNNRYDYSKVKIKRSADKVEIICPVHGSIWQMANNHSRGQGCNECGQITKGFNLRLPIDEFIQKLKSSKPNMEGMFMFDKIEFQSYEKKVSIGCKIHGYFKITAGNFIKSSTGCPKCAKNGFNKAKSGTLYILESGNMIKIGITNNAVRARLQQINRGTPSKFSIIKEFYFENGEDAYILEQHLLKEYRQTHRQPLEIFDGSTECFLWC